MILLFGGTGFIGSAFVTELNRRGYKFINVSRKTHDYTNPVTLHHLLLIHRPEFVINAAGFTGSPNVDECESRKSETLLANTVLPANLAAECSRMGIPFGHVSSGCIYNGYPAGGYCESDPPDFNPASWYSTTKMLAEEVLINHRCYIWRLRMPFDEFDHPKNYLSKLRAYPILYNATNSLSHRGQCVSACIDLWQKNAPYGVYNVVNPYGISTRTITRLMNKVRPHTDFKFFETEEDFRSVIRAPRSNCTLNIQKLESCGIFLPQVSDSIFNALTSWQPRSA